MGSKRKHATRRKTQTKQETPHQRHRKAAPADKREAGLGGRLTTPTRLALVIFVLSVILYANTLGHGFVWDDFRLVVQNPALRAIDLGAVKAAFTREYWPRPELPGTYYRPLTTLTYYLNYTLHGTEPLGYHLFSVLANALTCVFVFLFVRAFFQDMLIGFVAALLFALHPIHTENVAWVAGRTDILATLWMMVSLGCYVLFKRKQNRSLLALSLAAFFLALLSKESAIILPLVIALVEFGPFGNMIGSQSPRGKAASIVSVALFFIIAVVYLLVRREAIGVMTTTHLPFARETVSRSALPLSILAGYVLKLFFPVQPNAEYDAPVPDSFLHPYAMLGAGLLVLIAWCAWRFRRRPAVVLGIGVFLLGLAPVLNVVQIGEVSAERFLYFPSLGFAITFGWIFSSAIAVRFTTSGAGEGRLKMSSTAAGALVAVFVIVLLACVGRVITRNGDWKNEDVLFAKTAAQSPNLPRPHVNMGNAARKRGDIQAAVRAYQNALRIDPNYPEALNNLAGIYAQQGKFDEAIAALEPVLRGRSDNALLLSNLGYLYYMKEDYGLATTYVERALELDPGDFRARYIMGSILLEQNNAERARGHFKRAAEGGPQFAKAYYHLAVIESDAGNTALAKEYAQRFLAVYVKTDEFQERAQAIVRGNR